MERIYIQDLDTWRPMTDDEFGGYLYMIEKIEPERLDDEDRALLEEWKKNHPL